MERWMGKVVVITGASAGIGLATARLLISKGMLVVGLARRKTKMEEEMGDVEGPGKFYPKECDVTNEEDVNQVFEWIKNTLKTVHILINNAGVLRESTIEDAKTEDLQFVMNVNVMGLLYCTRQAIKLMKENGDEGHIININSIAGHKTPTVPGKHFNIYPATKFAVRSISEALTHELIGSKIRVCNLSPGLVKTDIFKEGQIDTAFLDLVPALTSEDIANSILHVIEAPPHVQITELTIKPLHEMF